MFDALIDILDNLNIPEFEDFADVKISSKILELIKNDLDLLPHTIVKSMHEKIKLFTFNESYGYVLAFHDGSIRKFVTSNRPSDATNFLLKMAWGKIRGKNLKLEANEREIEFSEIKHENIFETEITTELKESIKPYLDNNIKTGLLLYGPPGTGKTSSAYKITRDLGLTTIVIDSSMAGILANSHQSIYEIINSTSPDALIIDDFNRFTVSNDLGFLDKVKKMVKLLILTVNDIPTNTAMLRPGRIDMRKEINLLDKQIVCQFLGEYTHLYDVVKGWPISYINALKIEIKVHGEEKALKRIEEWKQTIKHVNKSYKDPFTKETLRNEKVGCVDEYE
jgi:SpoVK/Ycf46/Vps4 family AAA+-type ATPase